MASPNLGVKHLSEQEKGQIVAYKDSGLSDRDVAAKLNRHHATISSWYKKYGTIGIMPNGSGGRRYKKLSPRELSHVKLLCRRDPFTTIRKLKL